MARPLIEPVTDATLPEFSAFLEKNLDPGRNVPQWIAGFKQGWCTDQPNYGFVLRAEGVIVGGIGAIYADRIIRGERQRFCNITSWCVLDAYRQQSMRLAMAVIGQPGFHFTDFSPTKVVASSLLFLKFKPIDERQVVLFNLPLPGGGRLRDGHDDIAAVLGGQALQDFEAHRHFPWLAHVALEADGRWCHVIWKRMKFKGFAAARVLYVSDRAVFAHALRRFGRYLVLRGVLTTHVDFRVVPEASAPHAVRSGFNPKVYLSTTLEQQDIDYLYSESMAFDLV